MTLPSLHQTVLDGMDVRSLAEFYRQLLGFQYRAGDEISGPDQADWLVLLDQDGVTRLAFQRVPSLPAVTWPEGPQPQMMHLDLRVPTRDDLDQQSDRALQLGARLLLDRADDEQEPLRVFADPASHPFCIFVRATPQLVR